jgi:ribosome-binding protein aMBF1 (putative translation factor)
LSVTTACATLLGVGLRPPPNVLPEDVTDTSDDITDDDILAYFGAALRAERVRRGWEPAAVAKRLGQARTTVLVWESGRGIPRFTNLMRLLALFPGLVDVLADLSNQLAAQDADRSGAPTG